MKKGQVTAYIILGIVIVAAFAFVFFARSEFVKSVISRVTGREVIVPLEFRPTNELIKDCLNGISNDAIYLVGIQGGYVRTVNHPTVDYFGLKAAYLNDNGKNLMPSKSVVEKELTDYINLNAKNCITNFSNVEVTNVGKTNTIVTILDNSVKTEINWPLDLKSKELTFQFKKFDINVPIRLGALREIILMLIEELIENRENICMSCIANIGLDNNLYIEVFPFNNDLVAPNSFRDLVCLRLWA